MKFTTEISISELKAILEIIQELAKGTGLDEAVTRSLFKKLNEKHLR